MPPEDQQTQVPHNNPSKKPAPRDPPTPKEAAVQPSGPRGDNPSTAGPGQFAVRSDTPENSRGQINPSAPEDVNTTPGTAGKK